MKRSMRARVVAWSAVACGLVVTLVSGRGPSDAPPPSAPELRAQRVPVPQVAVETTPSPSTPQPTASAAPTRVVIVSVDGLRPDVITPDLMPRHVRLMSEGTTARFASTIRESDTLPSHAAMLSGVGPASHGLTWNSYKQNRGFIRVPTVFSAARSHGLSTAMIVGKQKLRHIAGPTNIDHYERPSYLCGGVAKRAAAYFASHTPDLMFVHFSDPDEYGHSHGWLSKEYLRAAKNSDRCLGVVLDAIDASPAGASTLVIVTADHGGDEHHHSDGRSKLNSQIPWIARGPGVERGALLDEPVVTFDTAATTLAALALPALPRMRGAPRFQFTRASTMK